MKVSRYVKDGKVRMARYVRYDIRQPCANAAYPSRISLVQSCVDDLESLPVGLRVNISGLSGSCTTDIDYARTSGFLCDAVAGSTVLNPDCPPSGWSYIETELPPTALQATVSAVNLSLPEVILDDFYPAFNCLRAYFSKTTTYYNICMPLEIYPLNFRGSGTFGRNLTHSYSPPCAGGVFSVWVSCTGAVYAQIAGLSMVHPGLADVVNGSGSVSIDSDCSPIGTVIIPMYLNGVACIADCTYGGMGCADVAANIAELPFYTGNLTINFARA